MDKPIRVLHVLQRMEAGGTQALLMNIYRNIDRTKIQFDFLVEYPKKEFYDDEILKLGGKIYYSSVRKDFNIIKFKKQLKNILKENNYKIIHVHAYTIGYFVLKTAKKYGVSVRIAHSHSNNMTNDYKKYIKKIMQKIYLLYATDFMACSKEAGNYLFKNKKYIILNNAIDSKKFIFNPKIREKIRKELSLEDSFVVGHVGRFKKEKNHAFLLNVFSNIIRNKKNAKLLLIGSGSLENDIKNQINDMNLNNKVIILNNRSDVNELLQAFDIFIFPSIYEGLGIVAIESQAAGTPILISNGVPDEAMISPIIKKISLNDSSEKWAKEALKLSKNDMSHTDMQKYIIEAGYDMQNVVNWLQKWYLEKYRSGVDEKNKVFYNSSSI